ncbi:hypothetical protein FACS1894217_01120 [Clostridia bacterium]|nr:hypothetical protein FACS1894217_01120 [Clostridia bacterium]
MLRVAVSGGGHGGTSPAYPRRPLRLQALRTGDGRQFYPSVTPFIISAIIPRVKGKHQCAHWCA